MYLLNQISKEFPNKFVVCDVALRDGQNGIAIAYNVLKTCDTVEEVREVLAEDYRLFGVATGDEDLPPDLAARMHRRILHFCL